MPVFRSKSQAGGSMVKNLRTRVELEASHD
jgi:hypothetical protein